MIGAAIWYFPQGPESWTGRISAEALHSHHPESGETKPKLTADHEYPRKVAAVELLQINWDQTLEPGEILLQLYAKKYGRFNYITPRENRSLMSYQRATAFQDPMTAYAFARIRLVSITRAELVRVKARDAAAIEAALARAG
jgi:hypothetical protein